MLEQRSEIKGRKMNSMMVQQHRMRCCPAIWQVQLFKEDVGSRRHQLASTWIKDPLLSDEAQVQAVGYPGPQGYHVRMLFQNDARLEFLDLRNSVAQVSPRLENAVLSQRAASPQ